jgi:hypothetical protein
MKKAFFMAGLFLAFLLTGPTGVSAQRSSTCIMVGSGAGWSVWRDNATGSAWLEFNARTFVVSEIRSLGSGLYSIACTGYTRKAVDGVSALGTLTGGFFGYGVPVAAVSDLWSAICWLGD